MSSVASVHVKYTSPYHDYFQLMFEGADAVSAFWQPLFKGIGRQQLEFANLSAKQGQALFQFQRNVAVSPNPASLVMASVHFWQSMADQYAESTRKLAIAVSQAAQPAVLSELLTLPVKRSHDMLVINPSEADAAALPERKVA